MTASSPEISQRIVEALMARKLQPGSRLGEQQLATLFGCSRTMVREALTRLSARGLVTVSSRRGWYVVEPTREDAREAFDARLVIETGLIRSARPIDKAAAKRLRAHLALQKAALAGSDVGSRSFLLGDFHVCLAQCLGNRLLADSLRDLTARTTLIAMKYQSVEDAARSWAEHVLLADVLEAGDMGRAEQLMAGHLGSWELKLPVPAQGIALAELRSALAPIDAAARDLRSDDLRSDTLIDLVAGGASSPGTRGIKTPADPRRSRASTHQARKT